MHTKEELREVTIDRSRSCKNSTGDGSTGVANITRVSKKTTIGTRLKTRRAIRSRGSKSGLWRSTGWYSILWQAEKSKEQERNDCSLLILYPKGKWGSIVKFGYARQPIVPWDFITSTM